MADSRDLVIRVTFDGSGAVTGLTQLDDRVSKTTESAEDLKTSFGETEDALATLGNSLAGPLSAIGGLTAGFVALSTTLARGSEVGDVTAEFDRLSQVAGTLGSTVLAQLNEATGHTVDQLNIERQAIEAVRAGAKPDEFVELTKAARALAEQTGGQLTDELNSLTQAFETGRARGLQNKLGIIDIGKAEQDLAAKLGVTTDALSEEGKVHAARTAILEAARRKTAEVGEITADFGDQLARLQTAIKNAADQFALGLTQFQTFGDTLERIAKLVERLDFEKVGRGIGQLGDVLVKYNIHFQVLSGILGVLAGTGGSRSGGSGGAGLNDLYRALDLVKGQMASTSDAQENLIDTTARNAKAVEQLNEANKEYAEAVNAVVATATKDYEEALDKEAEAAENAANANKQLIKALQDTAEEKAKAASEFNKAIGESIGQGLAGIFNAAVNNGDLKGAAENLGGSVGGVLGQKLGEKGGVLLAETIGGALGATLGAIGGPLGAAVGAFLGEQLVDGIASFFEGRDAQGAIRDSLDRMFADILKDNPLQAIINGSLQTITDLTFGKGTDIFATGAFDDLFSKLPQQIQEGFQGAGTALAAFVDGGVQLAGQLAAVLSNNLGGSLNNLQLLIKSTGKSADELRQNIVQAFLDGQISALEAQTAIQGLGKVMEDGIPDSAGDVVQAFANLKAAGVEGGRASTDALRDLAAEANKLGIETIPQLFDNLVASGKFTAEEIKQVQDALAQFGISTLGDLSKLSDETAIAILANLQANAFPFEEVAANIDALEDKLNALPKDIRRTITFDVKVNVADQDREILNQAGNPQPSPTPAGQGIQ